jgi:epsilon-lactone hydrolase
LKGLAVSAQSELIHQILSHAPFDLGGDPAVERPKFEAMLTEHPLPDDVRTTAGDLGGIPVIWVDIAGAEADGALLLIHGGGFAIGSARASLGLASDLARRTGTRVVTVDYRLAPEHPFPAALDDVTAAYRALLEQVGDPGKVIVSGESAGGSLALTVLLRAREDGLPMPAAVFAFPR